MDAEREKISTRKKRVQWTPDAERFFMQIWKNNMRDLERSKKTRHIYEKMSKLMIDRGFNFSARELTIKMSNLKNKFQDEKKIVESGVAPEGEWRFYRAMDYIMGNRRGYKWKELMADCEDPLYDSNEELAALQENRRVKVKDAVSSDYEENGALDNSTATETKFVSVSPSEADLSDGESESEFLQNSQASAIIQEYIEEKPKIIENDGFRIIADGLLHRKRPQISGKDIPIRNGIWHKVKLLKKAETDKHNAQHLNLAELELIKIQNDQIKQEMHFRSQEFEQKTLEYKLRLRYMQEEHELRMMSLRNGLKTTSQESS